MKNSLFKVSNSEVKIQILNINLNEIVSLNIETKKEEYIVTSNRVDTCLSIIYNISRSETKNKINKGDLYINDKNIFFNDTKLQPNDVISFRGFGKFKYDKILRNTKSGNLVVQIYKYV